MFKAADAFIALPGGFGTMDELIEMVTWCGKRGGCSPIVTPSQAAAWVQHQARGCAQRQGLFRPTTGVC